MMCQDELYNDLNQYDPFEPLYVWNYGRDTELFDEPMEEYNWQEWLANE